MLDFLQWRSLKKNTAPGTLIYAGQQKDFSPEAQAWVYDADSLTQLDAPVLQGPAIPMKSKNLLFIQYGIHDAEVIRLVGESIDLHPLTMEDILNTASRPKMEWLNDYLFIVLKNLTFNAEQGKLLMEHVCVVMTDDSCYIFAENKSDIFRDIIARLQRGKGKRIRSAGSAYMTAAVMDALIDNALDAIAQIAETAETLEEILDANPSEENMRELYWLRRELIPARNMIKPMRDIVDTLVRSDELEMNDDAEPYFRDVRDHAHLAAETVDGLRDMLAEILELQISLAGLRMNKIMQFLTLIATIFIPLTFIAGVYGMNFEYMPELKWHYGYHVIWGLMALLGCGLWYFFSRRRWL